MAPLSDERGSRNVTSGGRRSLAEDEAPDEFNPHDSLGEAYLKAGRREQAIENYRKSLELNPANENARAVLRELGVEVEAEVEEDS